MLPKRVALVCSMVLTSVAWGFDFGTAVPVQNPTPAAPQAAASAPAAVATVSPRVQKLWESSGMKEQLQAASVALRSPEIMGPQLAKTKEIERFLPILQVVIFKSLNEAFTTESVSRLAFEEFQRKIPSDTTKQDAALKSLEDPVVKKALKLETEALKVDAIQAFSKIETLPKVSDRRQKALSELVKLTEAGKVLEHVQTGPAMSLLTAFSFMAPGLITPEAVATAKKNIEERARPGLQDNVSRFYTHTFASLSDKELENFVAIMGQPHMVWLFGARVDVVKVALDTAFVEFAKSFTASFSNMKIK